jgi:hypothetical protein
MRNLWKLTSSAYVMSFFAAGCGGHTPLPVMPPGNGGCSGSVISGTMQDSLTHQPVAQGWAALETGTPLVEPGETPVTIYTFSQTQTVASDAQGAFSLCSSALAAPAVVVLVALDASGNAYPAFVSSVTGATDLGTVAMGGCTLTCGLEGQQQTSAPATISGTVTSTPAAEAGTVAAQYSLHALDGSSNLWSVAVLPLDPAQSGAFATAAEAGTVAAQYSLHALDGSSNLWSVAVLPLDPAQSGAFATAAGACPQSAPDCASYQFTLPSQSPVELVNGGLQQAAVSPFYVIYASLTTPSACTERFALTDFQQDGTYFLSGTRGAQLTAATIGFNGCK